MILAAILVLQDHVAANQDHAAQNQYAVLHAANLNTMTMIAATKIAKKQAENFFSACFEYFCGNEEISLLRKFPIETGIDFYKDLNKGVV